MHLDLPYIHNVNCGYISTPVSEEVVTKFVGYDSCVQRREDTDWFEYSVTCSNTYPSFLNELFQAGIPFFWEFNFTEDFSYYAYFFPTEDNPTYHGIYSTTDRKNKPKGLRKNLKAINTFAAASELLFKIGVNPNGTN